jgi:fatty acid-binding protein DegV
MRSPSRPTPEAERGRPEEQERREFSQTRQPTLARLAGERIKRVAKGRIAKVIGWISRSALISPVDRAR